MNQLLELFSIHTKIYDFSWLKVDTHSHILPGLDDGARNINESIEMIKLFGQLGFKIIYATPHVMKDLYPNTPEDIFQRLSDVRNEVERRGINIKINAAAEYFLDEYFEERMRCEDFITFPGKMLLLEMSFVEAHPKLYEYLFELQTKGYKPILAHPERYRYLAKDPRQYDELKHRGCRFQVNLLSLAGVYGKDVMKMGMNLLKNQNVEFLGSDAHSITHLQLLRKELVKRKYRRLLKSKEQIQNVELCL